jgi:HAD superfamily hydrolase (TIGR01509 family)
VKGRTYASLCFFTVPHLRKTIVRSSETSPWPQAVLFDFDGTLADSYGAIAASVNYVREQSGVEPLPVPDICRHVGRGLIYLLEQTVPSIDVEMGAALYREHHPKTMCAGTKLLPGAVAALTLLKQTGRQTAVCSNKPKMYTEGLVDHLGLRPIIDEVLGPEDVETPKPAPDMLLEALRRLRIDASDALYVGDMVIDIQTARAAGVTVWVVPTGSDERGVLERGDADRMMDDLNAFVRLFSEGEVPK